MTDPKQKRLETHRLGEGIIYTANDIEAEKFGGRRWFAGLIIRQHSDTVVDLVVFPGALHGLYYVREVEYDVMAERPGTWAATK